MEEMEKQLKIAAENFGNLNKSDAMREVMAEQTEMMAIYAGLCELAGFSREESIQLLCAQANQFQFRG